MPESLGWPKKCKKKSMVFHTEKLTGGKSMNISQVCQNRKKIWNQSQKNFGLKNVYSLVHPNSGSWSPIARIFITKCSSYNKSILPEKNVAFSFHYKLLTTSY